MPVPIDLRVDLRVTGFAMLLAAVSAIVFALLPALRAARVTLAPALHGTHATADRTRTWLRQGLVAGQVAMSLLLLVAAGLFVRSLQRAATIDPGIDVRGVDTLRIDTRIGGYRTSDDGLRAVDDLIERFRALPGVTSVAASHMVPLQGGGMGLGTIRIPGRAGPRGTDVIDTDCDVVTPDYFATLQLRIVQGRPFTRGDRSTSPLVVIVNERFAADAWPGQDPLGKTITLDTGPDGANVARCRRRGDRDVSRDRRRPRNFYYLPMAQHFLPEATFYIRHDGMKSRINDLRQAVVAFNSYLPVIHTQTLATATTLTLIPQMIAAWVAGAVGTVGLLLAAFGLYGLTAFTVAQRTREIAIRIALGSSQGSVLWDVLRQAGRLAIIGASIGLALAAGCSFLLGRLLIGLTPIDPVAFGTAVLLLLSVLVAASIVPARRAARLDPVRALRAE